MTALLNYIPILFAIVCYFLAGKFPSDAGVHSGLLVLAGALVGSAIPRLGDALSGGKSRNAQAGHSTPTTFMVTAFVGLIVLLAVAFSAGCHNVKPDQFFEATVDCAKVNPENSARWAL